MIDSQIRFSVGVCAFNEENNIEKCIRSIFNQNYDNIIMEELIIVSSGCCDKTNMIIQELMKEYPEIRLIEEKSRNGKNAAINCFLNNKKTELVAIVNADNILASNYSLQQLIEPFTDETIGMTGGHPIPMNSSRHVAGFSSQLIWSFHHHIANYCTKIGELIAFRDIGVLLPIDTQSDEDYIRKTIELYGLKVKYVPEAITYIRGPETINDLIKQRSRVNIGQSYMKTKEHYYNPSRDPKILMIVFTNVLKDVGVHPIKFSIAVFIEVLCRIKGIIYVKEKHDDLNIWDQVQSTKKIK